MEAVRHMPYGIQQPAVSGQILQLESDLGTKLFQRRPFELTPAGQELFAFVQPFFENVEVVGDKLRGGLAQTLRLAAPLIAFRHHLPEILQELRRKFPRLKLTLREGNQPTVAGWIERQEVDLAITLLDGREPTTLNRESLLSLSVVFLVPRKHPAKTSEDILSLVVNGNDVPQLVTMSNVELAPRALQELLKRRGLEWPLGIEVTAADLIDVYVETGFGIGLTVAAPGREFSKGLRGIPVDGIAPIELAALWKGNLTPVTQELLVQLKNHARILGSTAT
jgi:DNA-binding transcriptional LysR family regulator